MRKKCCVVLTTLLRGVVHHTLFCSSSHHTCFHHTTLFVPRIHTTLRLKKCGVVNWRNAKSVACTTLFHNSQYHTFFQRKCCVGQKSVVCIRGTKSVVCIGNKHTYPRSSHKILIETKAVADSRLRNVTGNSIQFRFCYNFIFFVFLQLGREIFSKLTTC